jgi:kynurenine formamidase
MRSICVLALLAVGCASQTKPTEPAPSHEVRFPPGARIVELTHPFDEKTPYWPNDPPWHFGMKDIFCNNVPQAGFFFCLKQINSIPEHGGTHLDAPMHFAKDHPTVDKIPLGKLIAPAVVIDISAAAAGKPDYALAVSDIEAFEKANGPIEKGTIVLVRTNWTDRWPDRAKYFGNASEKEDKNLHFPGISAEAAKLLVQRGVAAVGIDGPSLDPGDSQTYSVHQTLLGADIPQFENVASLKEVPAKGAMVIALPMVIAGGTGAPLHIVAVLPPG